jgi:hypothetical protein
MAGDTPQADRIGAAMRKAVEKEIKAFALDLDRLLRRATPVDTGHARRNWIPSVGAPVEAETNDDGPHEEGVLAIASWALGKGSIWESNPVDYIEYLNYGSSKKAPAGFVELCIGIALERARARGATFIDVSSKISELGEAYAGNVAEAFSPFGDDE